MTERERYREQNATYWDQHDYERSNVDHDVFRVHGTIFGPDFDLQGNGDQKLLDYGCGQGVAVDYFAQAGFDSYGVDVSQTQIGEAKSRYPDLADKFERAEFEPDIDDEFFGGHFDVIVALQSLYYYSVQDLGTRVLSLYRNLCPGGVFYATMIGDRHELFEYSEPGSDGLRKVNSPYSTVPVFVNFTSSEAELQEKFEVFESVHTGFYNFRFRNDVGESFHYTFVGRKGATQS